MGGKKKKMKSIFTKDFLWGASTSSHQVEGSNTNNWSEWEKITAKQRASKIPNWYKFPENLLNEASDPKERISGLASDSFHKWREDIRILKELGLNSYRFSIEWSRVFPSKGVVSSEGIKYYKDLVNELKKNNIEPIVTCWHWTLPLWLTQEGGLMSPSIEKYFKDYFDVLADNFKQDVKYWITINEPDTISYTSYFSGEWPPQERNVFKYLYLYYVRMVRIHRLGYKVIKKKIPNSMIGIAKQDSSFESYPNTFVNRLVCSIARFFANELYLNRVRNSLDFIGLNYYFHNKIGIKGIKNVNDNISDMGWWLRPDCLYYALIDLKKYNKPIIITENGVADSLDVYRGWWLDETFKAMKRALEQGVNLIGYMYWSLLDNFEWAEGFWPKFGLVEVDRKNFDRRVRKSGYHYRELVKENL